MEPKSSAPTSTGRLTRIGRRWLDETLMTSSTSRPSSTTGCSTGPVAFLGQKRGGSLRRARSPHWVRERCAGRLRQDAAARRQAEDLHGVLAGYEMIGCFAGKTEPVPRQKTLELCFRQYAVPVDEPFGHRHRRNLVHLSAQYWSSTRSLNRLLVRRCHGPLGFLQLSTSGQPLVSEGWDADLHPPLSTTSSIPSHHPSYIEFFHRLSCRRPAERGGAAAQVRARVRREPQLRPHVPQGQRLPRRPPLLHVVLGRERPPARGSGHRGWGREQSRPCSCWAGSGRATVDEAIDLARGKQGRNASISLFHCPPILMADVG